MCLVCASAVVLRRASGGWDMRNVSRVVLMCVGAAFLLAGCTLDWPMGAHDPAHTANAVTTIDKSNIASLEQAWSVPSGGSFGTFNAQPAIVNGVVYATSAGRLTAYDLSSGAPRWSAAISPPGSSDYGSPTVANGTVYVESTSN